MMRAGIAADHGGFSLKEQLTELLRGPGYEVVDFGAHHLNPEEDYPDFIISPRQGRCRRKGAPWSSPLRQRRSVHRGEQNSRCACRLIHNVFPAHQGVEDDNMNVFCLGGESGRVCACPGTDRNLSDRSLQRGSTHRRRLAKVPPVR